MFFFFVLFVFIPSPWETRYEIPGTWYLANIFDAYYHDIGDSFYGSLAPPNFSVTNPPVLELAPGRTC